MYEGSTRVPAPRLHQARPMRALLTVNPAAGRRTAGPGDLDRATDILRDGGFSLEPVETGAEHPTAAELAARAITERFDACVVAGGDGTVAPVAAALLDTEVVLGILPFGSFMNIANGLAIPLVPREAAARIAKKDVHHVDAGEVNGTVFFEAAGIGLDAELFVAARHAERGRWRRAARRVYRWFAHGTHRVTVTIGEESHTHRVMQMLVLNGPYYAWAFTPLPGVRMDDGLLDVAVFPRMGRLALLRSLVAVWRMRPLPQRPVRYRGSDIAITSDEPLTVHADGVLAGTLPARFRCRARALKVF